MISRLALTLTITVVAGCGPSQLPVAPSGAARPAATAADPRSRILTQVQELVRSRIPGATVSAAGDGAWQELGARDGNTLRFDLITAVRRSGLASPERVEFYGDVDRSSGNLVAHTLLVVSDTEASFRLLVPGR